jgi:hypothetical protein
MSLSAKSRTDEAVRQLIPESSIGKSPSRATVRSRRTGEEGRGLVDEISGHADFHDPDNFTKMDDC